VDVFVAVGSSGTLAGMILGKAMFRCEKWRIVGVPICDSVEFFQQDVRELMNQTIAQHELDVREFDTPIELLDGFIGEGYAQPSAESVETLANLARSEGIVLDPTYTSKAMTGMLAAIRTGTIRKGAMPVFIHTGGVFGLMARRDLFPAE
jgi:D-cysteine desulfhydrase